MTAVTGAILSAWAAFSVERGGARPGSPLCHPRSHGTGSLCHSRSHGTGSGPSSQPVQTCLSRPEFSFLPAATHECSRWGRGRFRRAGRAETKRELSQSLPGVARIPSTSLSHSPGRGQYKGSLCGGRVPWSPGPLMNGGRGKVLASRSFICGCDCCVCRFCLPLSSRTPVLVYVSYFLLYLFEHFKRPRVKSPLQIARSRSLRAKPLTVSPQPRGSGTREQGAFEPDAFRKQGRLWSLSDDIFL